MNKIKNIIFDLGGVIMGLDVPRTIKNFKDIGITNIVNDTGHHYNDSIFYDFEIGKVNDVEFLERLLVLSIQEPSHEKIKDAWNSMILDMPKERIDIILQLKDRYRIFLLSNTNSIHQNKFKSEFKKQHNFHFNDLFKKAYYSHEIGMRKPEKEVFDFVLRDSGLNERETLFIDDSLENIKIAQKSGIQTFHLRGFDLFNDIVKVLD